MSFNFDTVIALKKGEVIWECSQYGSLQVELLEDPVVSDVSGDHSRAGEKKVEFMAKVINHPGGREIHYLLNNLHMHYGPKLYRENAYMSREEMDAWRAEAAAAYAAEDAALKKEGK